MDLSERLERIRQDKRKAAEEFEQVQKRLKTLEEEETQLLRQPAASSLPKLRLSDVLRNGGYKPQFVIHVRDYGIDHIRESQVSIVMTYQLEPSDTKFYVRNGMTYEPRHNQKCRTFRRIAIKATIRVMKGPKAACNLPLEKWPADKPKPRQLREAEEYIERLRAGLLQTIPVSVNTNKDQTYLTVSALERIEKIGFSIDWEHHYRRIKFSEHAKCLLWMAWVLKHQPNRLQLLWPELFYAVPLPILAMIADYVGPVFHK